MIQYKETEDAITLHGLGFLQVKLGANQRLHVWHPDLPRRSCFEHSAIHDHRFDFRSRVLIGIQRNIIFRKRTNLSFIQHMSYLHEGPRTEFGNRPWIEDGLVSLDLNSQEILFAGQEYYMPSYTYHMTDPNGGDGRIATLMTKLNEGSAGAHSLCLAGVSPDMNFDRKQWPAERMWAIVREVLEIGK